MTCRLARWSFSTIVLLLMSSALQAAEPVISSVDPPGFQRGTVAQLQLRGNRLDDAEQLLLYDEGITVERLEKVDDKSVKAHLRIADDCPLGIHAIRLRSQTGISNLRTFAIGPLPVVDEVEPNNDFAKPQPLEQDRTIHGVVENEDVDYFEVQATKGERLTVELEGLRLGNTFFDPYVAILNQDRFELARSDDEALLRQDPLCSIIVPDDGKYIIQVRESSFGGSGDSKYRLHVGRFPRPLAAYPAGGKPGQTLELTWIGGPEGQWKQSVTLPDDGRPTMDALAEDAKGIAPSPNVLRVSPLENVLEQEPNDARDQATAATAPGALNGIIEKPGDVDHFRFHAKKGQQYEIRVYAREPLRSPLDPVLTVRRSNGAGVGSNDDNNSPDSYFRLNAPEEDDYLVIIQDHLKSGGPEYVYRVEVSPVEPSLSLVVPEKIQYFSTTMSVPQGNRGAMMVTAARGNFGGELKLELPELPEGIEIQTVPMADDRSEIPVLFTAAEEAPLAGLLARLVARTTDEKLSVSGELAQRTMLVRGQNNRDVWGHDAQRLALAVTDKVPFQIEIAQPQVPLVRRGSMQLKVIAKREDGFTAPIQLSMLYNPPGVGSSGSVSIAEGQSEAVIPLTANENAAIRTWPIVVLGRASIGNGNVEVASQLADLVVAENYLNLELAKAAAEQGQETEVLVKIERNKEFQAPTTLELLGLPAKTAAETGKLELAADAQEARFKVKVDAEARPGRYNSLVCRAVIVENGEPITQTMGGGELRIDKPLPAKPAAEQQAKDKTNNEPAPKKALTRLEQLRLERQQLLQAQK